MVENGYFKSGGNELFYFCTIPEKKFTKTGVIFVHAAQGNSFGPHRMFVELSARFSAIGLPTFRFDLSGCGDSTGSESESDIAIDVSDTAQACRFFIDRAGLDSVILFGISRGARICYSVAAKYNLPLAGLILLSTPASTGRAAINSFSSRLKEYICKLKDPWHLGKLLHGRIHIYRICSTLLSGLLLAGRYKPIEKGFPAKCPVLLIYGGSDPITPESSRYYIGNCNENDLPYKCHVIAGANHSFFHYKWKEEIFDLSKKWLKEILGKAL